jgi:hypothetical protein
VIDRLTKQVDGRNRHLPFRDAREGPYLRLISEYKEPGSPARLDGASGDQPVVCGHDGKDAHTHALRKLADGRQPRARGQLSTRDLAREVLDNLLDERDITIVSGA